MKKRTIAAFCILFVTALFYSMSPVSVSGLSAETIILENGYFRYEIAEDGTNVSFTDKTAGIDYLAGEEKSRCASVTVDGMDYPVSAVTRQGDMLTFMFDEASFSAGIRVDVREDHIILEVASVTGTAQSFNFVNVPLTLEGMPYEPFAACALSLNLYTHVRQLPALQSHLWANCYERFQMAGAKVALTGVPAAKILPVIQGIMKNADEVPLSTAGGAWAKEREDGYGSYLMNFGTLTDDTVDEWIEMCQSLGFNQIDNHGGGSFFKFGDFELNPEKWPDGWEAFKRINKRLHDAGIKSIFHTYAFFIDKNTKYVTPVPHTGLGYFRSFTLAEPADAEDDEIVVKETTANVSTTTGFFVRNSRTLRIGTELIEFTDVSDSPPYRFTGCKRGVNGTEQSAHDTGEKAYHLKEMFGRFVPGHNTELFNEIARRQAEIINLCDFDGIYFDAIDGSDILGGAENFWYYGTKFIFEITKHLNRHIGMEMSSMSHHWWHYRSRWQAWDRPVRGYKRFIDIHSAAIKSDEYDHGLWRGHRPCIEKLAPAENGGLLLPLHFGWWGNQTWNPPQVEPTFPDIIEYLCCKMIGNDAGLSMLGGVDKKALEERPLFKKIIAIVKQYEELRHKNYFSEDVKAMLRQPGKEFSLFQQAGGEWNFKPVKYDRHKVAGLEHPSASWSVQNDFGGQPVKLRIEALMSVKPYNDPYNVILADFRRPDNFKKEKAADGVDGGIENTADTVISGGVSGKFTAFSAGESPREGSWLKMEKTFEPWLDIEKQQALGVWVYGDGNGELLNFRLESPRHLSHGARGDHYVKVDFKGWKYFELVEVESSESSNYMWPDSGFYVYDSYRHAVKFNSIDKLQLWYNNLPEGKNVECLVGPVKALPMVPVTLKNPTVIINGKKITFPVELESGMYLEYSTASGCILYGSKGETLKRVEPSGEAPLFAEGKNEISFSCRGPDDVNTRVQVTVISEGSPLAKR